jgi:hypothetical protein
MKLKQLEHFDAKNKAEAELKDAITFDENGKPVSYIHDDKWDFSFSRKFSTSVEKRDVCFDQIPKVFKKEVQIVLSKMLKANAKLGLETLKFERGNLVRIAKNLNSPDWNLLNNDLHFRLFKKKVIENKYGVSTVQGMLCTINQLFKLKLTNRLVKGVKATTLELASKDKQEKRQHIAIPEDMAVKVFRLAEVVVKKYHPVRNEISLAYHRYYKERDNYLTENPSATGRTFGKLIGSSMKHDVSLENFKVSSSSTDLNEIKTACMILILGYSGVRHGEGLSIGRNSYKEKEYLDFNVPYLEGLSTKPNEGGLPKKESWITHPIVKTALELLFDITEFARDIYKKKYSNNKIKLEVSQNGLLSTDIAKHKENVLWSTTSLNSWLNKFLSLNEITATEKDIEEFDKLNPTRKGELELGGYLPKLSSHDFRRTFAVFLMRNKLGSIMALKHQYKHLNIIMSQWYANNSELVRALDLQTDTELQELIHESNVLIMTEAAFEIFNSPTLSGGEGDRIFKERESDTYNGNIYTSRKELERQVRAGKLSLVENPTGYCFNPECTRVCASEISSVTCKHEAITRGNALDKLPKRTRLINKFNNLLPFGEAFNSIKNRLFVEIKAIEFTLQKHAIQFEPFNDKTAEEL